MEIDIDASAEEGPVSAGVEDAAGLNMVVRVGPLRIELSQDQFESLYKVMRPWFDEAYESP